MELARSNPELPRLLNTDAARFFPLGSEWMGDLHFTNIRRQSRLGYFARNIDLQGSCLVGSRTGYDRNSSIALPESSAGGITDRPLILSHSAETRGSSPLRNRPKLKCGPHIPGQRLWHPLTEIKRSVRVGI